MADAKKPKGWGSFLSLARRVVAVPKDRVDAAIAQKRAARKPRQSTKNPQK